MVQCSSQCSDVLPSPLAFLSILIKEEQECDLFRLFFYKIVCIRFVDIIVKHTVVIVHHTKETNFVVLVRT